MAPFWFLYIYVYIYIYIYLYGYIPIKSWKSLVLYIRFIENANLAAFSKHFLLLNNRKQTMGTKRVCAKLSNFQYPLIAPNQLTKSHWKSIYQRLKWNDTEHTAIMFEKAGLINAFRCVYSHEMRQLFLAQNTGSRQIKNRKTASEKLTIGCP